MQLRSGAGSLTVSRLVTRPNTTPRDPREAAPKVVIPGAAGSNRAIQLGRSRRPLSSPVTNGQR